MPVESEIIEKILAGETNYFEKLLDIYQRRILAYCLKMLNFHQQDAEDVTAQVFVNVYINLASYNKNQKFSSWIYRIAHNEAVNFIKKRSKTWTIELSDFLPIFSPAKETIIDSETLNSILNQLKQDDKEILILFYLQELSLQEISDVLKLSENTIAKRLSRARTRAKEKINNKEEGKEKAKKL